MVQLENHKVADYYGHQANSYVVNVRERSAYRRAVSEREQSFVTGSLKPDTDVLEIGCGPGFFTQKLVQQAKTVMATDISQEMVDVVQANVTASNLSAMQVDVCDLEQIPNYGQYDSVVCMRVLCHVDDPQRALSQLVGAVRPEGNVIFDFLNAFSYVHLGRKLRRRPLKHTNYYSVEKMRSMISHAGLDVVDSFGRGYPYVGPYTLDTVGYRVLPALAHGVGFNAVLAKEV